MEKLMALQKYVRQLRPIQEKYVDHVEQVQDLFEAKIKAEDYEAAIVIGWHENNGIKFNLSLKHLDAKLILLIYLLENWNFFLAFF